MIADNYNAMSGDVDEQLREELKEKSEQIYDQVDSEMPFGSIKLGLALGRATFTYEVLKDHDRAIEIAEKALTEANEKINGVEENDSNDTKSMIELLKENLKLWKGDEESSDEVGADL